MGNSLPRAALILLVAQGCGDDSESACPSAPTCPASDAGTADSPGDSLGEAFSDSPVDPADAANEVLPDASDEPLDCDPSECEGCCRADGTCAEGLEADSCGYEGFACVDCTALGRSCKKGICVNPNRLPNGLVDDETIVVSMDEDVERVRRDLIRFVWGGTAMPASLPSTVTTGVASPETGLVGFERIDELMIEMDMGFQSWVYVLYPAAAVANDRLVVFHQGHSHQLGANGGLEAMTTFLQHGYTVVALQMPLMGPNAGPVTTHDEMMALASDALPYHPMKFFLEPVAVALNHVRGEHAYADEAMTGISGGGWTTTLYAALDPRIRAVLPVAGTLPLYLRTGGSKGDGEQYEEGFYEIAGYPDLYVLGSHGSGRAHVQVLNRYDTCCFSDLGYRLMEPGVRGVMAGLSSGDYRVFLDESHAAHQISPHAMAAAMLPELDGGAVRVVDDTSPAYGEFMTVGTWTSFAGGFGGYLQASPPGVGDVRARWTVPVKPGTYRVSATWEAWENRATDAKYEVEGSVVVVDQQQTPSDLEANGRWWADLVPSLVVTGEELRVELSDAANGYVIADGVRVERLGP